MQASAIKKCIYEKESIPASRNYNHTSLLICSRYVISTSLILPFNSTVTWNNFLRLIKQIYEEL